MLNKTEILRYIRRKLGASTRPLPISDEDIIATIQDTSLYTFSNYYPFMLPVVIEPSLYKVPNQTKKWHKPGVDFRSYLVQIA